MFGTWPKSQSSGSVHEMQLPWQSARKIYMMLSACSLKNHKYTHCSEFLLPGHESLQWHSLKIHLCSIVLLLIGNWLSCTITKTRDSDWFSGSVRRGRESPVHGVLGQIITHKEISNCESNGNFSPGTSLETNAPCLGLFVLWYLYDC